MSQSQRSNGAPPPFFADSDDRELIEGDFQDVDMLVAESPHVDSDKNAPRDSAPLFFADSDDDDEPIEYKPLQLPSYQAMSNLSDDVDIPELDELPRASSVSSASSNHEVNAQSRSPSVVIEGLPVDRPTKKRKLSPPHARAAAPFDSSYLGCFLVPNAWSTVRGSGYVRAGDEIQIERDSPDEDTSRPAKPAKAKAGSHKSKNGKKQISIATMMKPAPAKTSKKKKDLVVRLTNLRGFGEYMLYVCHASAIVLPRIRSTASGCRVVGVKATGPR